MGWAIASTPPLKSFAVECTVYSVYVYTSIVETVDESEGVVVVVVEEGSSGGARSQRPGLNWATCLAWKGC